MVIPFSDDFEPTYKPYSDHVKVSGSELEPLISILYN